MKEHVCGLFMQCRSVCGRVHEVKKLLFVIQGEESCLVPGPRGTQAGNRTKHA